MKSTHLVTATLLVSVTCVGSFSSAATSRGPAACEKLTGRDRSKCLADARRNRSEEESQSTKTKTKSAPADPSKVSTPAAQTSKETVWPRVDVSSPQGFRRYDQFNSGDSRLYASSNWAEGMDTVSKVARKKLTCLATVYAMIEHARGNLSFQVSGVTYSDSVGALRISGVSTSRAFTNVDVIRSEFQSGNPVILWGPLSRNPSDPFGHFILAVGVNSSGKIVAHDPYGGQLITIDPATRKVSGSGAISVVEKFRTVKL